MVTRRLPDGVRVYAVGDVHGYVGKLNAMHEAIRADLERAPAPAPLLIHLGDYIDRGPHSAGCLDLLAAGSPLPTVNLLGNHEAMLLTALDRLSPQAAALWLDNGGDVTLESWGIPADAAVERWAERIPAQQLALLRSLALHHTVGDYTFVHAGVRPGVPLLEQSRMDLLWIREGFLDREGPMLPEAPERCIVHGHTPSFVPVAAPNRIGVDTNAGRGGPLTCAVLDAAGSRFIQV